MSVVALQNELSRAGQDHLIQQLQSLSSPLKEELVQELQGIDLDFVCKVFTNSCDGQEASAADIQPASHITRPKALPESQVKEWTSLGYRLIAQGKAAVLLLAGGQGTRLGSSLPKGCFNIGLPSGKSLFQLQAERLLKVQALAVDATSGEDIVSKPVMWYIMTSAFTHTDTTNFFFEHNYFGLSKDQVVFFQQGELPCLSEEGKIILRTSTKVAKAPDGNGGLYMALHNSGTLGHMRDNGVECVDCFSVDNVLVRVADPAWLGCCYAQSAQCGARVLTKQHPDEKVGVFALKNGKLQVVEYSEITADQAHARDEHGELLFNWGNICMHYFSVPWLKEVHAALKSGAAYHVARKTIPSKDGPVKGIKLELFIFDTFQMAERVTLMEVERSDQFSPVKNAPGTPTESPDTARRDIMQLHRRWVESAGGKVLSSEGVEISASVSYAGEGLQELCQGLVVDHPYNDLLQGTGDSR